MDELMERLMVGRMKEWCLRKEWNDGLKKE